MASATSAFSSEGNVRGMEREKKQLEVSQNVGENAGKEEKNKEQMTDCRGQGYTATVCH